MSAEIRRRQLQLVAGEGTTAFASTLDVAQTLGHLADFEGKEAQVAGKKQRRYHLARREAFLEALQVVLPA